MTRRRANLLAALCLVVLAGGLALMTAKQRGPAHAVAGLSAPPGHAVVISKGAPVIPADASGALSAVQAVQVSTFSDLQARLQPDDLLIIDASALDNVPGDFLAAQVRAGRPVMGLNISAGELNARTGFLSLSAQIQPRWGKDVLPAKPGTSFFTVLMLRKAGTTWQRVIAQPAFRDGLFRSYLNQARLAAQGLTYIPSAAGDKIVPLTDLGGTPTAP